MPKPKAITRTTPTQQKPQRSQFGSRLNPEQPQPQRLVMREVQQYACVTTDKGQEWAIPGDWVADSTGGQRMLMHLGDYLEMLESTEEWEIDEESPMGANDHWLIMTRKKWRDPIYRDPKSPPDPNDHKNALELQEFLQRRFDLGDVHIGYIMDALKHIKLSSPYGGQMVEIRGTVKRVNRRTAKRVRKSA